MKKIAINGLGRIGKLVFQYLLEEGKDKVEVVAINDLSSPYDLYQLLKHDSTQTPMSRNHELGYDDNSLVVDGVHYPVYAERKPEDLPWGELGVDIVCECTGLFASYEKSYAHIKAGAKKVIINCPVKGNDGAGEPIKNIVFNVNSDTLTGMEEMICGASCTTNCLSPVAKVVENKYGIKVATMATIHSVTADQAILDRAHKKGADSRRGRSAMCNIVPTTTGAAKAVAKAIPSLKGKLDGMAYRVPTPTGSVTHFVFVPNTHIESAEELNAVLKEAQSETLGFTMDPIVSTDVIGISEGCMVDGQSTMVTTAPDGSQLCTIVAWYDNEASYTHQYVKTVLYWASLM